MLLQSTSQVSREGTVRPFPTSTKLLIGFILFIGLLVQCLSAIAAPEPVLPRFLSDLNPQEVFPGANRFGELEGSPPVLPAFDGREQLGYVFVNSDYVNSTGYSGKPIHMVISIDMQAIIRNVILVEHHEPIVLIGIPEKQIVAVLDRYIDIDPCMASPFHEVFVGEIAVCHPCRDTQ